MITAEPLIKPGDYEAFQTIMPKEQVFKDAPTGIQINFATFSIRQIIRIQSSTKPDRKFVMVTVEPDKFEQYCANFDKDRNWQSLKDFADAKYEMGLECRDNG